MENKYTTKTFFTSILETFSLFNNKEKKFKKYIKNLRADERSKKLSKLVQTLKNNEYDHTTLQQILMILDYNVNDTLTNKTLNEIAKIKNSHILEKIIKNILENIIKEYKASDKQFNYRCSLSTKKLDGDINTISSLIFMVSMLSTMVYFLVHGLIKGDGSGIVLAFPLIVFLPVPIMSLITDFKPNQNKINRIKKLKKHVLCLSNIIEKKDLKDIASYMMKHPFLKNNSSRKLKDLALGEKTHISGLRKFLIQSKKTPFSNLIKSEALSQAK